MKINRGHSAPWIAQFVIASTVGVCAANPPVSSRYEQPKARTGTIYEAGSGQKHVLFKYRRTITTSATSLNVVREYTYPDGKIAARETVVYQGDQLISYDLEELQIGAHGSVQIKASSKSELGGEIAFTYVTGSNSSARTNSNKEKLVSDTIVPDMMGPFLVSHWDELMKGKTIKCRYLAVARTETVGFSFVKTPEGVLNGKPVVNIKMSPSSFVIAALVDPLYFVMEKDGEHRTLQYTGRTTPKIKDGNKWKDLDAETVFDWD